MNANQEKRFYQITKKENNSFEVALYDDDIANFECEDLIQCDTALVAKQPNGLFNIYLPILVDSGPLTFEKGFICAVENVKEFYYHNKTQGDFNGGLMFFKIETGNACGYWSAFDVEFFEWYLTPERAKTRRESLFQIPYNGTSTIRFLEEFDYLPLNDTLVKIDNIVYAIRNGGGSIYSESNNMILKELGDIMIEPLPFEFYFKATLEEGECFLLGCSKKIGEPDFGPFYRISEVDFEGSKFPPCYFGFNEDGKVQGMFFGKFNKDATRISNDVNIILFEVPVSEAQLIEIISTSEGSMASWKLSYDDGRVQIMLCSVSNNSTLRVFLDVSKYI